MNNIILDKVNTVKYEDKSNSFDLNNIQIREEFSIKCFLEEVIYSSSLQIMGALTDIIELMNFWKKVERVKGRKPKFSMLDTYADVENLILKLVQYSARL